MRTLDDPDEVYQWDLTMLYNCAKAMEDDINPKYRKLLQQAKHGIKIKIPIYYITQEWYELYAPGKTVGVQGHGKYNMQEFMDEIEEREKLLRKIILENQGQDDPTEAR